ncbi:hypothetical protein A0256_23005 [Mucilaginibacter sp. PAMC 26640]|nr:hypothetical protein A0256_23005 [Mucilaginibacter sp. PAMC 26640]
MLMDKWLVKYESAIAGEPFADIIDEHESLAYWHDRLFFVFLKYCSPFSLIALIPGVILSLKAGLPLIAIIDILSFLLIVFATFARIAIKLRKFIIIGTVYILAIVLIDLVGYVGPGVFYLFAITILSALIFPVSYAYKTILINALILIFFSAVIHYRLFNSTLIKMHSPASWLVCSSNLIFLSLVLVALINYVFKSLYDIILHKDQLQERYKSIFEKSPIPMWLFDTTSLSFLEVNGAAIKNYGYNKEEFLSMTIKDIRPPEFVADVEQIVEKNKLSGDFYSGKAQHTKKNGEIIYVSIESNMLNLDGRSVRLVLATDITAQLINEMEIFEVGLKIRQSESNLRAIFESSVDGFVLLDGNYRVKAYNANANNFVRLNEIDLHFEPDRLVFDFVQRSNYDSFRGILQQVYNGEVIKYGRTYTNSLGEITYVDFTVTPVYENSLVCGICISGRDTTDSKRYLKTIEEQNKRFREISWMQSHLVRAPLARIMGLTDLLGTADIDTDRNEILQFLRLSSTELDTVIREITKKSNSILQDN